MSETPTYELLCADCTTALQNCPDDFFDAVVCDPPYGLEFMGVAWDTMDKGCERQRNEWRDFGSREHPRTADAAARVASNKSRAFEDFCRSWAGHVLRVLKPGGHLVAFGGTRTYHRLACAIEDAGFEIRDSLHWIYGSGFPKSHDVSKGIDKAAGAERTLRVNERWADRYPNGPGGNKSGEEGDRAATVRQLKHISGNPLMTSDPVTEEAKRWAGWGTALKPAHEPIILARKPLSESTVAENVQRHGVGALNIDATRIEVVGEKIHTPQSNPANREGVVGQDLGISDASQAKMHAAQAASVEKANAMGRFPANVLLGHSPACVRTGTKRVKGSQGVRGRHVDGRAIKGSEDKSLDKEIGQTVGYVDEDGMEEVDAWVCVADCPVRIMDEQSGDSKSTGGVNAGGLGKRVYGKFSNEKPNANAGGLGDSGGASRFFATFDQSEEPPFLYCPKASKTEKDAGCGRNSHPTVKPIRLMSYLVRMVTPPGGKVLDPFVGSGTTVLACFDGGFSCVGIDQSSEYLEIAQQRLAARQAARQAA